MSTNKPTTKDTIPVREGEEINREVLGSFLKENIDGLDNSPLEIKQFNTGSSNLTYLLQIGTWEAVLRRAPKGPQYKNAHNMEREYKVLKEVNPYFELSPKPYLFTKDSSIIGAPFFIMERKQGVLLEKALVNRAEDKRLYMDISNSLIDTLVSLHEVDYKKTGLTKFTNPDGFLKRQVNGWIERYENVKLEDNPKVEFLQKWLIDNIPTSPSPTIIHYDYHLNNIMFDKQDLSKVISLLDWEMSTVGDPFTDLATAMVFWIEDRDPEDYKSIRGNPITTKPGFMSRNEFIESYCKRSGRDISNMNYYMALAYYKNLVIVQQIYYRWKKGFTNDDRFSKLNKSAPVLLDCALGYIN